MENMTKKENRESFKAEMIHFVLSHSYVVFLGAIMSGAIMHLFAPIHLFTGDNYPYIGFTMIILGSVVIYWAQSASSATRNQASPRTAFDFERGPYKYSRNPTHIGMTIMTLGLAITFNSLFTVIFLIITSLVTKFIFLKKEECLLEEKYGQPYLDYKKKVSTWV